MILLGIELDLLIPDVYSLKEKRRIKSSLMQKVRQRFNVTIAEVDHQDLHQRLIIGIATVGNQKSHLEEILDKAVRFIEDNYPVQVINQVWLNY